MSFELGQIALICILYLLVMFGVAFSTDKGWIPDAVVRHPATYILSLGVFASAWSFYGVIELANQHGYGALAYYLGTGALFLFAPVALAPLVELAKRYQISSLADLLVFRYHSQAAGSLVTLLMFLALLPLLALQIQAVADTLHILTLSSKPTLPLSDIGFTFKEVMALLYCAVLAVFTILFGSNREKHRGLITAMAFESLIKLCAFCAIGLLALYGVFDGLDGLDLWLAQNPERIEQLYSASEDRSSHTLLLVFIATAVAMPHIFHMSVVENPIGESTHTVSWAFPLFLLLMALPLFPILWAGFELNIALPAQYFTLGIPMALNSPTLTILAFVGGLSAATGALVATALAMSTMLLNHWLLPFAGLRLKPDLYSHLVLLRRILIILIFAAGYSFYQLLGGKYGLTNLALMAFIGTLQFLPGIFAVAYWPQANRRGLMAGLNVGGAIWAIGLLLPAISGNNALALPSLGLVIPVGHEHWNLITLLSLGLNTVTFTVVSILSDQSDEERYSADLCGEDELSQPMRLVLDVHSAKEFKQRLENPLGETSAKTEVNRALKDLNLGNNERRPYALRRLRDQIEANLAGLMGVAIASEIVDQHIPFKLPEASGTTDINFIENRLAQYRNHLTGMAAELNNLRLYHRKTLEELPMAACSLGQDLEVLMWNRAMHQLTGISSDEVTGSHLGSLPQPWQSLIGEFSHDDQAHSHNREITLNERPHWVSLHKANIEGHATITSGQVILLEDVTETQLLERELVHSERLASVGRLAAGVAHEIGNPITGIACLVQNLKYETDNPEILDTAAQILSQTERVSRIVHSLVSFSHSGQQRPDDFQMLDLATCANEAIHLLSLQLDKHDVAFSNEIDADAIVPGDTQRLIQVFINLLSNARDASPAGSTIYLSSNIEESYVTVSVIDEGEGISEDLQERILEPFFTTKDPGEGTGLGLAMVYSIIEDHNGHLSIESPVDKIQQRGAKFDIILPRQLATERERGTTT